MPAKGAKASEQTRMRQREGMLRRLSDPEFRAKRAQAMAARRGHEVAPETRAKISAKMTGRKLSLERVEAMRESAKRSWQSSEYRTKVIAALADPDVKARIVAPGVVAKRNAGHRAYWASLPEEERKERTRAWSLAGATAGKPTTIELAVQAALTALGIDHIPHKTLGPFVADIYISQYRLVIECDGDYWHNLPKQQARDRRRDGWMRYHGYRVARLPESLIRQDALAAVKAVLPDG